MQPNTRSFVPYANLIICGDARPDLAKLRFAQEDRP